MLIVMLAIGFFIQYILGVFQIQNFSKHYKELRANGRVAIGRNPSIFKSGTLVLIQLNNNNEIEEMRYMQGVTVFSRFKRLNGLKGRKISNIEEGELKKYNKLIAKAIMDAKQSVYIIENGGEVKDIPSPLKRTINNINYMFNRKEVN
ncbi:transcriptional regulator GutM [Abyssicoccus albus]